MEKKIIIIALAFAVLLAMPLNVFGEPNDLTFSKGVVTTQNLISSYYEPTTNVLWAVGSPDVSGINTSMIINKYGGTNGTLISSNDLDVIISGFGGCVVTDMVPTDIWASARFIYITFKNTNAVDSNSGQVAKIGNSLLSTTVTCSSFSLASYNDFLMLTGRDSDPTATDEQGVNFWFVVETDSDNSDTIFVVNGQSMLTGNYVFGDSGTTIFDIEWSGIGGTGGFSSTESRNNLIVAVGQTVKIYNLSQLSTARCTSASFGANGGDIVVDYTDLNSPIIFNGIGTAYRAYDINCAREATKDITTTQTGLTANIRNGKILFDRDVFVIQEQGSNALISVLNYSNEIVTGTGILYETFPTVAQNTITGSRISYNTATTKIYTIFTGSDRHVLTGLFESASIPPSTTTGIDCEDPINANILICRLGGTGTLGSAGTFVIGDTEEGTGILGVGCSIGLVDCIADPNPQTNGLGLLIFIASIFVIVGMFFRSLGASATFQLPVFVWVMIIISLSAFFTITGLIDPVFLILAVIALIALAVPKVTNIIQGKSGFSGGSTE